MVTRSAFTDWVDESDFEDATGSPYLTTDADDQLGLIKTYEGQDGTAYEQPSYLYAVFEPVLEPAETMDEITIEDLYDHVERLHNHNRGDLSAQQRGFLAAESHRSRVACWDRQNYFPTETISEEG